MSIATSEVSIVMQGGLNVGYDVRYAAQYMRKVFPESPIILSTQGSEAKNLRGEKEFDAVILTDDPGALPPVKFNGAPHNLNRQIASSSAGLAAVRTPYAIKLRTDGYLNSRKLLDYWSAWDEGSPAPARRGEGRILVVSFFSVNPRFDERVPYHVSDWLQFGRTADLVRLWNCPPYDFETATWYETRPHAPGSLPREREVRSRYSSEQWLTMNYLYGRDDFPIEYHNHCTPEILDRFERALVDDFLVVHPLDIDLSMPKHKSVFRNKYFNLICYSHEEWKRIAAEKRGLARDTMGFTRWPLTERDRKLFMFVRTSPYVRFLRKVPGKIGRKIHRTFYSFD